MLNMTQVFRFLHKRYLPIQTFLGVAAVLFLIGYLAVDYVLSNECKQLLTKHYEANIQRAQGTAKLLEAQLKQGFSAQSVLKSYQQSIAHANTQQSFICVFNNNGVQISHPDPAEIGHQLTLQNSVVDRVFSNLDKKNFYSLIKSGKSSGGIRRISNTTYAEIIYLQPVKQTNWLVASHENIASINEEVGALRHRIWSYFIVFGLVISLLITGVTRSLNIRIEQKIQLHNLQLHQHNQQLTAKGKVLALEKQQVEDKAQQTEVLKQKLEYLIQTIQQPISTSYKTRFLLNRSHQLVPVMTQDIAYFFTRNKVVYAVDYQHRQYNLDQPLEDIIQQLDPKDFFRVNRQYILSIDSIAKIHHYGNSKLKIETNPATDDDIIISKAKVKEFKNWVANPMMEAVS